MNSPDRIFTSTNAMTKLATDDTIPKKLQECKVSAVRQAAALADAYAREGIREDLVNTVMEKKIDLILNAQTVQEVRRAASLPKPRFTGAEWGRRPIHRAGRRTDPLVPCLSARCAHFMGVRDSRLCSNRFSANSPVKPLLRREYERYIMDKSKNKQFHAVSLSGGKDSTAMLILMIEKGMPIDAVIMADTGMEFPEIYQHL